LALEHSETLKHLLLVAWIGHDRGNINHVTRAESTSQTPKQENDQEYSALHNLRRNQLNKTADDIWGGEINKEISYLSRNSIRRLQYIQGEQSTDTAEKGLF
jgi:hypothetical protein